MECHLVICLFSIWVPWVTGVESSLFSVSTVTYSPNEPGSISRVSLVCAATEGIAENSRDSFALRLHLPKSFIPVGEIPNQGNCASLYARYGQLFVEECIGSFSVTYDRLLAIEPNDFQLGSFAHSPVVAFISDPGNENSGAVVLRVTLLTANTPIKFTLCCVILPDGFDENSSAISIDIIRKSPGGVSEFLIPTEAVMIAPRILAVSHWDELRLQFEPALPTSLSQIIMTFEAAQAVPAGSILMVNLPGISRVASLTSQTDFVILESDKVDTLGYQAIWDAQAQKLMFISETVLLANSILTVKTMPGEFRLPAVSALNSPTFTVLVTNADATSTVIPITPFFQADEVVPEIQFLRSEIIIGDPSANISNLDFLFSLNRVFLAGDKLLLKLAGYQSNELYIALSAGSEYFGTFGIFDPSTSVLTLTVTHSVYFDGTGNDILTVGLTSMTLPEGQYQNDPSLKVAIIEAQSSEVLDWSAVLVSARMGVAKEFSNSTLSYFPNYPNSNARIVLTLAPSITLFSGTIINLYLRGGFSRSVPGADVAVYGESSFVGNKGTWDAINSCVSFTISSGTIIDSLAITTIDLPASNGFTLPDTLSENDGVILLEAIENTIIYPEKVKSSPQVGTSVKRLTNMSIGFNPLQPNEASTITIGFTSNTKLLVGSHLIIHLGGFERPSGIVNIEGTNAPSFRGRSAQWDSNSQDLILTIDVEISPGIPINFAATLFTLPNALSPNDQSLYIVIPEMGIADPQYFVSSDRVNSRTEKEFSTSQLVYGDGSSGVPYPSTVTTVTVKLVPTFAILPGATIDIRLEGFSFSGSKIVLSQVPSEGTVYRSFESMLVENAAVYFGLWNQTEQRLKLSVVNNMVIPALAEINIKIENQLKLPASKSLNDPFITIQVIGSQNLSSASFKSTPAIVPREFLDSVISFFPIDPLTTVLINATLVASVDIAPTSPVVLKLGGFTRASAATSITISALVDDSASTVTSALWDSSEGTVSVRFANILFKYSKIVLLFPESNEFILPRSIAKNSDAFTVSVPGSIIAAPFASTPLVGDGPYGHQQYCMYASELGVRSHLNNEAIYTDIGACVRPAICTTTDWVSDPCIPAELARCGCQNVFKSSPDSFVVTGFNLDISDRLYFVAPGKSCNSDIDLNLQIFSKIPAVLSGGTALSFGQVRALASGSYKACLSHLGSSLEFGLVTVRPKCSVPLVQYNFACYQNCPYGFVPSYGECRPLSLFVTASDIRYGKSLATSVTLTYSNADTLGLATLPWTDSTLLFFNYIFIVNLKEILHEADDSRFKITRIEPDKFGLQDGLTITFVIVDAPETLSGAARSALELFTLFSHLFADRSSAIYSNSLFKSVAWRYGIPPRSETVVFCESTKSYQALCPLSIDPIPESPTQTSYWFGMVIVFGGVFAGFILGGTLVGLYRIDVSNRRYKRRGSVVCQGEVESTQHNFSVIKVSSSLLSLEGTMEDQNATEMQSAKSWLKGTYNFQEPDILSGRK